MLRKLIPILALPVLASLFISSTSSEKQQEKASLILSFDHLFNKEPLSFNSSYQTAHGETVNFTTLNYFISNIRLKKKNGEQYTIPQDSSYFLIKHSDASSRQIRFNNVPTGNYTSLSFTIGVDSARNTMEISRRTGALDVGGQARGMYWVWNSGYIFFKLEGKSPSSPDSLKNNFAYHIGGYGGFNTKTINNIRTKTIDFKKAIVSKKKTPTISVSLELAAFFDNKTPIRIVENPTVMWGETSVKIADNYVTLFKLGAVTYSEKSELFAGR